MDNSKRRLSVLCIALMLPVVILGLWFWPIYSDIRSLQAARYEQGQHKGAQFCGSCHQEIYNDWSARSLHAKATTGASFKDYLSKFRANYLLNTFIGDEICFACHGERDQVGGVDCETCHGLVISDASIMETHSRKYKPGLQTLREQTFCANCHDLKSPLSGDNIFSLQDEWRASEAAARGVSCQGCHMKKSVNGLSYHGFDSAHRDATIYEGDLRISNAELQFPHFSLVLENRITGHAVPPSGPTRMLVMKITFLDAQGIVQHDEEKVFGKKFELMPLVGLFPNRLILNTQLQISEARRLRFALPASLDKQINRAVVSLRFYGVSDEHQGDITRAHWISDPILVEEFLF